MPQQVQFITGEGFDRWGKPIDGVLTLESKAYRYVADTFGGYSSVHLDGGWVSNNQLVQEPSLAITVFASEDKLSKVPETAEYLRSLFNQESVLVARSPLASLDYVNAETHALQAA